MHLERIGDVVKELIEAGSVAVEVRHMMGPMWSVEGRPVVVPAGASVPVFLLGVVAGVVAAPGPWLVRVLDGDEELKLLLGVDGSVSAALNAPTPSGGWWRR